VVFDADFGRLSDVYDGLDDVRPNTASYRRRVVIVLIDLSASMGFEVDVAVPDGAARPSRIAVLNEKLRGWLPDVRAAGRGQLREVEFAVVTFSGRGVRKISGAREREYDRPHEDGGVFVPATELTIDELAAFGTTPMVEAVTTALDLADARARYLAERGTQTGRVRVLMFTDGGPSDHDLPLDAWRTAADRIGGLRRQDRLLFMAFGAPGADETVLRGMAGDEGYIPLADFDFAKLLGLLLVATSADNPYDTIRDQLGWNEATA
jgi:uncharacterized protein YegL